MIHNLNIEPIGEADIGSVKTFLSKEERFDRLEALAPQVLYQPGNAALKPTSLKLIKDNHLVGVTSFAGKYLRLLLIDSDERSHGYGTKLLDEFESHAIREGLSKVQTMAEPGNYISPGIDVRHKETIEWLKRRGYKEKTRNENIFVEVANNPLVSHEHLKERQSKCKGYAFDRLSKDKLPLWQHFIEEHFSKGWAFEVGLAATKNNPSGAHVAYDSHGELAAFAAHDGNNTGLGWFGPTGTLKAHRGKGLAAALLIACLLDVKANGHTQCEVAWIGPRKFYEKVAGVCGERHFVVLEKQLSKGE